MSQILASSGLTAGLLGVARLCVWLVLLSVIFLPFERWCALHSRPFFRQGLAQDLAYYFINSLVPAALLTVPLSFVAYGAHAFVPYRIHAAAAALPVWQAILAGMVVGEVGSYWGHRMMHQVPFLWRFHAVHHAAEHVYFLTNTRAHPLDLVFVRLCGLIPVYLLGLASPLAPAGNLVGVAIVLIGTVWGFFIHANLRWRLGPLEWLVSTPAFHHWHHTRSEFRDRNYAALMPWVDRLFGQLPRAAAMAAGLRDRHEAAWIAGRAIALPADRRRTGACPCAQRPPVIGSQPI